MSENNNLCPACGFPKEYPAKPVCFYCFYRGTVGAYKMVLLNIFNNIGSHIANDKLIEELNKTGLFKDPIIKGSIRRQMAHMVKQGLLIARKDRHKKERGRYQYLRKITIKGKRLLGRYNKRWKQGMPPIIRVNKKKKKFFKAERYSNRASAIRGKITKTYDLYAYILPGRR